MGWFDDDRKVLVRLDVIIKQNGDLAKLLAQVLTMETKIMTTQAELKAKLDAVVANVADLPTKIQGIEQVLTNLAAEIKRLQDLIANSSNEVDPAIVAQVDAIDAAITSGKQRILDDINANTQPEPKPGA